MKKQNFFLHPFHKTGSERIIIQGEIGRKDGTLSLTCSISGCLSDVLLPKTTGSPERRDRLWEETCFEFFIGPVGYKHYWEFNLSPAGHWNVYSFTSYREGMKAEAAFESLPFVVQREPDSLKVSVELPLKSLIDKDQAIDISACAVIKQSDQTMSYWALSHAGRTPDFHLRDSFGIRL